MKNRVLYLFIYLLIASTISAQQLSVEADNPYKATKGTSSIQIEKPEEGKKAKGYIFSTYSGKLRREKPHIKPSVIVTGVFSAKEKTKSDTDSSVSNKDIEEYNPNLPKLEKPQKKESKKDKDTIAWITKDGEYFHDHLSPHESPMEEKTVDGIQVKVTKIWISEIQDLVGLTPCKTCFIKANSAPEFINKECGGLDIASASTLLDNPSFIEWAKQHLPISRLSFLTSSKLLIIAKSKMTKTALKQLAKETSAAFRRHTWKVIEVIAQNFESTEQESSF